MSSGVPSPHSDQLKVTEGVYELLVQEKRRRMDLEEQLRTYEKLDAERSAQFKRLHEQYEELNALHANGMFLGRPIEYWEGLQEQHATNEHAWKCLDEERVEEIRRLKEQLETTRLAGWTAERALMRIADGARSNPGGQVSEFAHEAAGNLRRALESNPASAPGLASSPDTSGGVAGSVTPALPGAVPSPASSPNDEGRPEGRPS